jgi:leader peptidase (prepilin peptidase) / N-methyltransferase
MVIVILVVLGLCLGSFVNALIWRIREPKAPSIAKGRSMCTHCKHELAPRDLIPVVSYVMLRGRCRYCGKRIEDTPVAEVLTPVLLVLSYVYWPAALEGPGLAAFVTWCVCVVGFVALILYDLRWYELPHVIVLPLIGVAAAGTGAEALLGGGAEVLLGALLGALAGGGLFWIIYAVSPEAEDEKGRKGSDKFSLWELLSGAKYSKWIGFGDVTLGVLLGMLVGSPGHALLMIFIASLLGTLVALPLLLAHRADRFSHLPFGPFLMAAAIIVVLWGDELLGWYMRLVLG